MAATNKPVMDARHPLPGALRATGVDDSILGRQFLPAIETRQGQYALGDRGADSAAGLSAMRTVRKTALLRDQDEVIEDLGYALGRIG